MRLTVQNLGFYLVDKGFMRPSVLIDGSYRVVTQQNRNIIFRVETGTQQKSLFIKQPIALDNHNNYAMQREATALHLIHHSEVLAAMRPYVTDYFGYDCNSRVLATEYLTDAVDLDLWSAHNKSAPTAFAGTIAKVFAALHIELDEEQKQDAGVQFFHNMVPWILQAADPLNAFNHNNFANNPVGQWLYQNQVIAEVLEQLRINWQRTTLIHGDAKLVNLLLENPGSEGLKLIDWEICDLGDPLWDIAGILQAMLTIWGRFQHDESDSQNNQTVSITSVAQFNKAFVQEYQDLTGHLDSEAQQFRLLQFTGVRLLQSCYEMNAFSQSITPMVNTLLAYVPELLLRPKAVSEFFLGRQL